MRQVVVFSDRAKYTSQYELVKDAANKWLSEHTDATIIASHTNMVVSEKGTEYALTFIVEMPDGQQMEIVRGAIVGALAGGHIDGPDGAAYSKNVLLQIADLLNIELPEQKGGVRLQEE